ncbi:uncharacterized protein [Arachis hypogaea]|uniref:uncharacterized protein isoform X4 n=1 Tax=Arachis hypogaea TaxID=3818 RepID=UPI003B223EB8
MSQISLCHPLRRTSPLLVILLLRFLSHAGISNRWKLADKIAASGYYVVVSDFFYAAIEDSSIDFGDFFKGPLPGKFLKLLGFLPCHVLVCIFL